MNNLRFDDLSRALGTGSTRRGAVGLLVASTAAVLAGAQGALGKRKRCKPACAECQACVNGRCRRTPDFVVCGTPGTGRVCYAQRCVIPCVGSCGGACSGCPVVYDGTQGYCAGDGAKTCDQLLPCTSHKGCSTGELCAKTACPAVGGTTNRCRQLCAA